MCYLRWSSYICGTWPAGQSISAALQFFIIMLFCHTFYLYQNIAASSICLLRLAIMQFCWLGQPYIAFCWCAAQYCRFRSASAAGAKLKPDQYEPSLFWSALQPSYWKHRVHLHSAQNRFNLLKTCVLYVQKDIMITMNICVSWLHVQSWLHVDWSCVWKSTLVHSVTTCSLLYSDLLIMVSDTLLSLFSLRSLSYLHLNFGIVIRKSCHVQRWFLKHLKYCPHKHCLRKINAIHMKIHKKSIGWYKPKSHVGHLEACIKSYCL